MNVLITGAAGFIGNGLLRKLAADHRVTCIIREKNEHTADTVSSSHRCFFGDVTDLPFMKRVIATAEPEIIFHMACQSIVRMCARNPVDAYHTNVMGTVTLLDAIRQVGDTVRSVVVSTSDKAYGHALPPYEEETPFLPKFTYEATKAAQDIVCQNYFHKYSSPVRIARLCNVYGPNDPNDSRLIPNTINRALAGLPPVIYEDVADFRREFIFIDDALTALIKIATDGTDGEAYCVGGVGDTPPLTIRDVTTMIMEACGMKGNEFDVPKRHHHFREIECQYMRALKIRKLGWEQMTSLKSGIKKTIEWKRSKN